MLNLIINAIGAVCTVLLFWCLLRAHLRKAEENSRSGQISIDDYLQKITWITGHSVYDTFHKSAEGWNVSDDRIEQDFRRYLATQSVPYYVKDFVRKSQKHIDELYEGKGSEFADKRLPLFLTFLTLLSWAGVVFLSLYVIPHLLPDEFRAMLSNGPP